jgi:hypothetical protein
MRFRLRLLFEFLPLQRKQTMSTMEMDNIEDVAQISCGHSIANSLLCFQNRQKFCLLESRAFEHLTFNREDYQPNVLQSVFQTALLFIYETVRQYITHTRGRCNIQLPWTDDSFASSPSYYHIQSKWCCRQTTFLECGLIFIMCL